MSSYDLIEKSSRIDFFRNDKHPELRPFVGTEFPQFRILQIGESHFIPNLPESGQDTKGCPHIYSNEVTLKDFRGWREGEYSEKLKKYRGWFDTDSVVKDYIAGNRDKSHGIFTNPLKSFCRIVTPCEAFESISTLNSKKYNYFAFMNFYQQPSIYMGKSFTNSLYQAGKYVGMRPEDINCLHHDNFERSLRIVEKVVDILNPRVIVVTSKEVYRHYVEYKYDGFQWKNSIIWLDHPGSAWWNRVRKDEEKPSRIILEEGLKRIYG